MVGAEKGNLNTRLVWYSDVHCSPVSFSPVCKSSGIQMPSMARKWPFVYWTSLYSHHLNTTYMVRYSNGIWLPDKIVWFSNGQLAFPMYCGLKTSPVFEWLKTRWPILPFSIQTQIVSGKWLERKPVFIWWPYSYVHCAILNSLFAVIKCSTIQWSLYLS
jgi:hypothetical protein